MSWCEFAIILAIACIGASISPVPVQHYILAGNENGHYYITQSVTRPQEAIHFDVNSNAIVYASYRASMNITGWDEMHLVTNPHQPDHIQAYYAGYLEGWITESLITSHYRNLYNGSECKLFHDIIQYSLNSTIERAKVHYNDTEDPYWHETALTLYQISGIDDGYNDKKNTHSMMKTLKEWQINKKTEPNLNIEACGTVLVNLYTEFDDLKHLAKLQPTEHRDLPCSAIIKVLPNAEDVLITHTTWNPFQTMLRIMKRYSLQYSTSAAKSVTFTGYPGTVFSLDDYYITTQNLVITETTHDNFNNDLYQKVDIDEMVLEFIRNTVANRLAKTGPEWAAIFGVHNSGTYNNQYMIIDFKQFKPGGKFPQQKLLPGFFYLLEQLPSMIKTKDMTKYLLNQTYWPSYNLPYFPEIYEASNSGKMAEKYGDTYSHENCSRAKIFRRDHHKVTNMTTLYQLIRYNNFKEDPLSRCNCTPPYTANRAIASRCDLNDPNGQYPFYEYGFKSWAATDAKLTNYKLAMNLQMIIVNGPTRENQPPFSWKTTKLKGLKHFSQPEEFNFKPIITEWNSTDGFQEFKFNF